MKLFRKNIVWHNVMMVMNCFVVWLNDEKRLALFLAGAIVRDTHYCESPPDLNIELEHWNSSRTWTCAEPEFRLISIKLGSSDNHYTTAPPAISGMGLLSSLCISPFSNSVTAFRNVFALDRSDISFFHLYFNTILFNIIFPGYFHYSTTKLFSATH